MKPGRSSSLASSPSSRRGLLRGAAALGLGAAAASLGREARAQVFGDAPGEAQKARERMTQGW